MTREKVAIATLSLADLQSGRYGPDEDFSPEKETAADDEMKLFPTLESVLDSVPSDVGFNIEIKYPQKLVTGINECEEGTQVPMFSAYYVLGRKSCFFIKIFKF